MLVFRHAAYDTPWWAFPSSRDGRFHRASTDAVQYLCLHPLGPTAEFLRHNVGPSGNPDHALINLWVANVTPDIEDITFDNCDVYGISPDELVGDDHGPTQALADDLRKAGIDGIRVPSAALPGTENLVLFGPRVLQPYLFAPVTPDDVPTGHLSEGARPPAEVVPLVRWFEHPHAAAEHWKATGTPYVLHDPPATRW